MGEGSPQQLDDQDRYAAHQQQMMAHDVNGLQQQDDAEYDEQIMDDQQN